MTEQSSRLFDDEILARLLTRRDVVRRVAPAAVAVAGLFGAFGHGNRGLAQEPAATPVGPAPEATTPVADVSIDAFIDLSAALVGGGSLDAQRGTQLLDLIAADPARLATLERLLAIRSLADAATPIATPVAALADDERALVKTILGFWYLGMFDGQPVTDRGGFWFSLSSWQAVEYTAAPSVCRAFGIWAAAPQIRS